MRSAYDKIAYVQGTLTSKKYATRLTDERVRFQVWIEQAVHKDGRNFLIMIVGNVVRQLPEVTSKYIEGTHPPVEAELHRRVQELLLEGPEEQVALVLYKGQLISAAVEFEQHFTHFRNLS